MSKRGSHQPYSIAEAIHSTRLHAFMYGMLLVATPFVLLQNFLVETISRTSATTVTIGGTQVPLMPLIGVVLLAGILIVWRRQLTWLRILASIAVVAMNSLAQQVTDYYFDHKFYDLQQNWHYLAYALFAYFVYRDLKPRRLTTTRIMLITFFGALFLSTFDEVFQMQLSSRVFDVSDIAKDLWGALMGILWIYLATANPDTLWKEWKRIRHTKIKGYFNHPPSLTVLMFLLAGLFLCFSSLLTDVSYWFTTVLLTVCGFAFIFFVLHISRFRWIKLVIAAILAIVVVTQMFFYIRYSSDYIIHNQYGLTVYKGIPIIFFDVMIFPDGSFRLVDKKHFFNIRDQRFFLSQKTDIIVIGSGSQGLGGSGFPKDKPVQFLYNEYSRRGTQVITLKTPEACQLFNRLKEQNKNVLFILHNTC
jgi:VanZ family protein